MPEPLTIQLNGRPRTLPELSAPTDLATLIQHLGLKSDRIAIEHNGYIAPRASWPSIQIQPNDRLEIVHFVGGGTL
jgi:sulfur carrier protein